MAISVTMPQMGESVVEGTIERWCVAPGNAVEKDQVLCEITTDKVDAEIPAPQAGVVTELLVAEGQTVGVGVELARIEVGEAAVTSANESNEPAPDTHGSAEPSSTVLAAVQPLAPDREADSPTRASPLARRIAEDHGVDLSGVHGSGFAGRIVKQDLSERPADTKASVAATAPMSAPVAGAAPGTLAEFLGNLKIPVHPIQPGDRVIPFSAIRRRVAQHMVVSKIVSPHVGTVAEVDLHKLVGLREAHKQGFKQRHGFNLTYLPFIVHATVRALHDFPGLNATVVGESIVERAGIHVGVAVETERGLLVPVIRDADHLSLVGLAQAVEDLARRARNREVSADELHGGTFTVTNPGREGNLYGFAVINQPQVGVLRLGEIKKRPVVVTRDGEDGIAIRPMMYLALSYDHRVIDGVTGNGFLFRVARYLEAAEFDL